MNIRILQRKPRFSPFSVLVTRAVFSQRRSHFTNSNLLFMAHFYFPRCLSFFARNINFYCIDMSVCGKGIYNRAGDGDARWKLLATCSHRGAEPQKLMHHYTRVEDGMSIINFFSLPVVTVWAEPQEGGEIARAWIANMKVSCGILPVPHCLHNRLDSWGNSEYLLF